VVTLSQVVDGTRSAAAVCAALARSFPQLRHIVMCGIAGGVPSDAAPLRLGDVVSAAEGIVDYDHVRSESTGDRLRRPVDGLSKLILAADRELQTKGLTSPASWPDLLGGAREIPPAFRRPPAATDPLSGPGRGHPEVYRGVIGSADRLVRDTGTRNRLARTFGMLAVEMEGSGIAVGADLNSLHWFVVRGISDYCDGGKNDLWQPYAALTAAAYTRALLSELAPPGDASGPATGEARVATSNGFLAVVEALAALLANEHRRRTIHTLLPQRIATQVPARDVPRLQAIELVQTCERYPEGAGSLLQAARLTAGDGDPDFERFAAAVRRHWLEG
jgi:nucleoside phosphorylase